MTKKNFITLILGTVGGILFALGMCMAMLPEWNAFRQGILVGCIGLAVLLVMVMVRRKMEGKPVIVKLSAKTLGTVALGAVGAVVFGLGLCMVMVWGKLVAGIALGLAGMAMAGLAYPVSLRVEKRERQRIAPEILRLTEELIK